MKEGPVRIGLATPRRERGKKKIKDKNKEKNPGMGGQRPLAYTAAQEAEAGYKTGPVKGQQAQKHQRRRRKRVPRGRKALQKGHRNNSEVREKGRDGVR